MTTIKLKNGSGAPLAGDLVQGEPALDLTNKRLYTEDSGGSVIEVGTNPTSLTTGTFTSTGIDDNATSTAITIDASENVGIGTSSPSSYGKFVVRGSGNIMNLDAASGPVYAAFKENTTNRFFLATLNGSDGLAFIDADGATERMRIDASGNVGIGTTTTLFNPLTVKLTPNANSKTSGSAFDGGAIRLTSSNGLSGTNSEMAILAGGEDSLSAGIGFARQNTTDWGTQIRFYTHGTDITTADELTERMRIDASGNLRVGTTSTYSTSPKASIGGALGGGTSLELLNTSGVSWVPIRFHTASTLAGYISSTTTTTSYVTSSDVRLKENIVDAPAGNIDAIRVRSFDWKADGSHQTYGMVAQELVDVAPEAVSQGATEDDMWGVDYSKLVPMMIKEIQDLKAEVAALKGA